MVAMIDDEGASRLIAARGYGHIGALQEIAGVSDAV
jgi:hypothetical protein